MERTFLKEEHETFRNGLKKFLQKEAAPHFQQWEEEK